jgi:hypothetical protein
VPRIVIVMLVSWLAGSLAFASANPTGQAGSAAACNLPIEGPDGPSTSAPWRLEEIDTAVHPAAICNDGSPAVYMIRRNPATTRWLVWLEGGGNCPDGPSCAQRWTSKRDLMTSNLIRARHAAGTLQFPSSGVFSVDPGENPALHDANMVQVQYCSSDLWSGAHEGNPGLPLGDVARWHFQGRAIALATIDELLAKESFGNATEITFAGGSAGSAGIYFTVDELRDRAPAGTRVIGISDAGYQIVYPAYDPLTQRESTATPTPVEQIIMLGQVNWGGRGDASCDARGRDPRAGEPRSLRMPSAVARARRAACRPSAIAREQVPPGKSRRNLSLSWPSASGQQAEAVDHLRPAVRAAHLVVARAEADALVQRQAGVHVGQVVVRDQRRHVQFDIGAVIRRRRGRAACPA